MSVIRTDIAIIGAGMAGASLAAMIGDRARIVLIEREAQPGYHSTGRSAAFWQESYGGPQVQPLTTASGPLLKAEGVLHPRGTIHVADADGERALESLAAELAGGGIDFTVLDRAALEAAVPGIRPAFRRGIGEPSCRDIDVAMLHARFLARARAAGTTLLVDAPLDGVERVGGGWRLATRAGEVRADVVVNAAGAWASAVAAMAGAMPTLVQPFRRTIVQLAVDPPTVPDLPLVMDARGRFYFKPEAGGRLWLSPHDETPVDPHDVAPEELDVAVAIDRLEQAVEWRVVKRERAWAGLRSFAPDRAPIYGFDPHAPGFFWCAGQGGFGIQTAPAGAMLAAALLLRQPPPEPVSAIDAARYAPDRVYRAG
ncbi:FAD-dependent oxidoreductase [uncultured Sphingomonas sp.]|uniref:NAD(P)/FAD-dependent oxidoreductase n=1 Tax=uncultured Sphingomonas sp. TaxID=158754 RepID=UPI0025E8650B|nr:FAD-dependent oxidoreductase [uncultured Sphingomonas sp.]